MGSNTILLEILKFLVMKEAYNMELINYTEYRKYLNDFITTNKREENEEDDGK